MNYILLPLSCFEDSPSSRNVSPKELAATLLFGDVIDSSGTSVSLLSQVCNSTTGMHPSPFSSSSSFDEAALADLVTHVMPWKIISKDCVCDK